MFLLLLNAGMNRREDTVCGYKWEVTGIILLESQEVPLYATIVWMSSVLPPSPDMIFSVSSYQEQETAWRKRLFIL